MSRFFLISLQIVIAIGVVLAKGIPSASENGLTYIGTFRSRSSEGTQSFDESNYYISQNAGAWNSAQADCKALLGDSATIVAIESQEEWEFLKEILENYGFATDYWTSGLYDPPNSRWRWAANNVQLPPFAPWGTGYPSTPNTLLRVLIYYGNRYDTYWKTVSNTQLHRYICEVQVPTIAIPCYQINDLAIVLDSSGSIGSANFEKAKQFVERLANAFVQYDPSRLSFITYSDRATVRIDLTNNLTPAAISSSILATPWEAGNTATDLAINLATSQLTSNLRGVPMNMVVLTDGASTYPALTVTAAQAAISAGIRTFSVGITQGVNLQELLVIAGNDANRVFTTDNFDLLINLLAPLSLKVCPS
ncbi:collagen alpha-5(VI) chain-like [Bradysia coprophila]|uniref:collagen alpha-5(VI) chain-like n=1 Tax=Bradysia coprophila TaxID=38358 RepID=UPI00187DBADC|nr:collagen alpha-5(VI) chain-like [Bradysia coprophila]